MWNGVDYHVIFMIIYIALLYTGMKFTMQDKEFKKMICLKRSDIVLFIFLSVFPLIGILSANFSAGLFSAVAFPYFQISALTDRKTRLVFITPMWGILILAVICESIERGHFSFYTCILFFVLYFMGAVGMFGLGDVPMSFIPGVTFYLAFPEQGFLAAMLFECIFMLHAQVIFWLRNMAEGNMKTMFRLKEARALGPSLLIGAYISFGFYITEGCGLLC